MLCTAPIGVELFHIEVVDKIGMNALLQQIPIGTTPAIDTLFHVADNQVPVVLAHAILQQRFEILPLQPRRILKFVQHEMMQISAGFFVHKRRVAALRDLVQKIGSTANQHDIFFVAIVGYLLAQIAQNAEYVDVFVHGTHRQIFFHIQTNEFASAIVQTSVESLLDVGAAGRFGGTPFIDIVDSISECGGEQKIFRL